MALFEGKQNVHLYVRFLAKLGAPLSSELLTTLSLTERSCVCTVIRFVSCFQVSNFGIQRQVACGPDKKSSTQNKN